MCSVFFLRAGDQALGFLQEASALSTTELHPTLSGGLNSTADTALGRTEAWERSHWAASAAVADCSQSKVRQHSTWDPGIWEGRQSKPTGAQGLPWLQV